MKPDQMKKLIEGFTLIPGAVTVVTGPVGAGKTEFLIQLCKRLSAKGAGLLAFKHSLDDARGGKNILKSRSGAEFPCISVNSIGDARLEIFIHTPDIVIVDETQFFGVDNEEDFDLLETIKFLQVCKVQIVLAGLNEDYQRKPFRMMQVLDDQDFETILLTANCHDCGDAATTSWRITGGNDQVEVGGDEKYTALCESCWEKRARSVIKGCS